MYDFIAAVVNCFTKYSSQHPQFAKMAAKLLRRTRRHSFSSINEAAKEIHSFTDNKVDANACKTIRKRTRSPETDSECNPPKKVATTEATVGVSRKHFLFHSGIKM